MGAGREAGGTGARCPRGHRARFVPGHMPSWASGDGVTEPRRPRRKGPVPHAGPTCPEVCVGVKTLKTFPNTQLIILKVVQKQKLGQVLSPGSVC